MTSEAERERARGHKYIGKVLPPGNRADSFVTSSRSNEPRRVVTHIGILADDCAVIYEARAAGVFDCV